MRVAHSSSVGFPLALALLLGGGVAALAVQSGAFGPWAALLGVVPAVLVLWFGLRSAVRRWRVVRRPLPAASREWLTGHVPLYGRLDDDARRRFERDVHKRSDRD